MGGGRNAPGGGQWEQRRDGAGTVVGREINQSSIVQARTGTEEEAEAEGDTVVVDMVADVEEVEEGKGIHYKNSDVCSMIFWYFYEEILKHG